MPVQAARRENVVFFRAREAAERAGFRPCKRCKPDCIDQRDPNAQLVEKVCRYIDTHPDEPVTLETLGRALGISPFYLQRTFKTLTGITPRAYADSRRLHSLKAGLRNRTFGDALALRRGLRIEQQAVRTGRRRNWG